MASWAGSLCCQEDSSRYEHLSDSSSEKFHRLLQALSDEFENLQSRHQDIAQQNRRLHALSTEIDLDIDGSSRFGQFVQPFEILKATDSSYGATGNPGAIDPINPEALASLDRVKPSVKHVAPSKESTTMSGASTESVLLELLGDQSGAEDYKDGFQLEPRGDFRKPEEFSKPEDSEDREPANPLDCALSNSGSSGQLSKGRNEDNRMEPSRQTTSSIDLAYQKSTKMVIAESVPAIVILLNALTIGLQSDIDPTGRQWDIFEAIFITCYTIELTIKTCLLGLRGYFFGEDYYWNWFDFTCLAISLVDLALTYVLKDLMDLGNNNTYQLLKFVRVVRLTRLVRVLHYDFFSELRAMVLGVISGVRVLFWAIVLLFYCIFFLGVLLNNIIGENEPEFQNVPNSMFTVFRCYTDGCTAFNGTPLQRRLFERYGALFMIGYILSFMFITIGVFNLIMAIFLDNVVSSSLLRKLTEIGETSSDIEARLKDSLASLIDAKLGTSQSRVCRRWSQLPQDGPSLEITRNVFNAWLKDPDFAQMLSAAQIEIANKADLFDVLDADMGGELETHELITGLMKLRGPITKSDIVAVRLKVRYMIKMVEDLWRKVCGDDSHDNDDEDARTADAAWAPKPSSGRRGTSVRFPPDDRGD